MNASSDRKESRRHADSHEGPDASDDRDRIVAASEVVHGEPARAAVLDGARRRRVPRAASRRGRHGDQRPGARRPGHPHERRLPPRLRPRGPLVVLVSERASRAASPSSTPRRRPAGRTPSARGSTRSSAAGSTTPSSTRSGRACRSSSPRSGASRRRGPRSRSSSGRSPPTSPRPCSRSSTDAYDDDKRELMWDLAGDPERRAPRSSWPRAARSSRSRSRRSTAPPPGARTRSTLDFYVDLFNYTVEGLDDAEIWVHTCWGNPGAQHCFEPEHLLRALARDLPRAAQGRRLDDRVEGQRAPAPAALRPVQGQAEQEDRGRDDQPPRAPGRDGGRGRRRHSARARVHRRRSTSCSRPTAASAARACRARSRSTRPRRSRRARTSSAASSAPTTTVRAADPALQIDVPAAAPAEVG